MDVYIVTLSDFYSYRLIGKLTVFLQFQEFSQRNQTWELRAFTFAARLSLRTVHTTHKVKTVQMDKSTGRHCGDIELTVYLANATLP
jgi:hypothetical protein